MFVRQAANVVELLEVFAERQRLYRKIKFERYTPTTPMSIAEVEAALRTAAARGYHRCDGEVMADVFASAVALPANGRTLSLVVAGPMFRCQDRAETIGR